MADSATQKLYREKFAELAPALKAEEAAVEANRCLYCYDAPCVTACPTHIDIPRFIKQIASGNLKGSAKTILEANPMGHSCARVCPVEVLCEGACVYHEWQERPIDIAGLQRRATDHLHENKLRPFSAGPANGKRVAVVGGGPGGLSAAAYLRRLGYRVSLFEKDKLAGGLNTFGVAEYKMDQKTALEEARWVVGLGVEVTLGKEIGRDIPAEKLLADFDAVFVAVGLGGTHRLGVPGEDLPGVWDAISFIRHVKNRDLGALGKSGTTVVIGAGNTSIDAVTQSLRTGAGKVVMAYRRSAKEMGAYGFEFDLAKKDGAEFLWNCAPVKILGKRRVEGIVFRKTTKRGNNPVALTGPEFVLPADRIIKAIGQSKLTRLAASLGLDLRSDGRIAIQADTLSTSNPKVFAGGDAVNGGKEVVNAAADGKRAAWGIHQSLFPGAEPGPEHAYWVSTIEGRRVAPIPERAHS